MKELIFNSFLLWLEGMMVMKEMNFNSFYFLAGVVFLKETDF